MSTRTSEKPTGHMTHCLWHSQVCAVAANACVQQLDESLLCLPLRCRAVNRLSASATFLACTNAICTTSKLAVRSNTFHKETLLFSPPSAPAAAPFTAWRTGLFNSAESTLTLPAVSTVACWLASFLAQVACLSHEGLGMGVQSVGFARVSSPTPAHEPPLETATQPLAEALLTE